MPPFTELSFIDPVSDVVRAVHGNLHLSCTVLYDLEGCGQASFLRFIEHNASSTRSRVLMSGSSDADLIISTALSGALSFRSAAREIAASSFTGCCSSFSRSIRADAALLSPMSPRSFAASARRSMLGNISLSSFICFRTTAFISSSEASLPYFSMASETLALLKLSSRSATRRGMARRSPKPASASAAPTRRYSRRARRRGSRPFCLPAAAKHDRCNL